MSKEDSESIVLKVGVQGGSDAMEINEKSFRRELSAASKAPKQSRKIKNENIYRIWQSGCGSLSQVGLRGELL